MKNFKKILAEAINANKNIVVKMKKGYTYNCKASLIVVEKSEVGFPIFSIITGKITAFGWEKASNFESVIIA